MRAGAGTSRAMPQRVGSGAARLRTGTRLAAPALSRRSMRASSRRHAARASAGTEAFGLILEADNVAIDLHDAGHRPAFNRAFKDLGMECANWTSRVYADLRRGGDGTPMGMVKTYFDTIGWPLVVTKEDHQAFARNVVKAKDKALRQMLGEGEVPLREGVVQLIDDALASAARVALLCGTSSAQEDNVASAISFALGVQRARHIHIVSTWGDDDDTSILLSSLDDVAAEAAKARAKVKQQEAAALVQSMKDIGVDAHILASQRQMDSRLLLRAAKQLQLTGPSRCALLGATEITLQAGRGAGMLTVSVPTALSGRYKLPSADLTFDGFGLGGGVTWGRLLHQLTAEAAR